MGAAEAKEDAAVGDGSAGEAMDLDSKAAAVALKSEEGTPANDNNDYDGINEVSFYYSIECYRVYKSHSI